MKVAICSQDCEYTKRFIRCFLHHYKNIYDLYLFESLEELYKDGENSYPVVLVDDSMHKKIDKRKLETSKILVLRESEKDVEREEEIGLFFIDKYQEVYKIQNAIQRVLRETSTTEKTQIPCKTMGVFSLECENQQISYCALLATECAEKGKTIVLNLQPYSGFEGDETWNGFRLEDLLVSIQTECYIRGRLEGAIREEENWDYMYSVKNTECLAEIEQTDVEKILEIMAQEFGYAYIIINFGAVFQGMHALMAGCNEFYFLKGTEESFLNRESSYFRELEQKGYEEFKDRMYKINIPKSLLKRQDWKLDVQQWRWSIVGDTLRMYLDGGGVGGKMV